MLVLKIVKAIPCKRAEQARFATSGSINELKVSRRCRSALTMIEILVALSIIGILIGLLLPAVQAARETARRITCRNNLKQIGLAMHQYHATSKSLPIGCFQWRGWRTPPTHKQFAWSAMLLPFLEQQTLHSQIDFDVPFDAAVNADAAATPVATYQCPSAPNRPGLRGRTDFGGLYGERLLSRDPDTGVFLYERAIRFKEVTDGLTFTLAVGEDVGGPDSEWINGRNVFVQSHGVNDPAAWIGDNEIRSLHPTGATVLLVDGSVRFLNESIGKQLLGALITRSGREHAVLPDH